MRFTPLDWFAAVRFKVRAVADGVSDHQDWLEELTFAVESGDDLYDGLEGGALAVRVVDRDVTGIVFSELGHGGRTPRGRRGQPRALLSAAGL